MPEFDLVEIDFSKRGASLVIRELLTKAPLSYPHRKGLEFCLEWLDGAVEFDFQTSGTTGEAKPMRIKKGRIEASVEATAEFLGLKKGTTAFVGINTEYTGGKMMLARALHLGMKVHLAIPQKDPFDLLPKNENVLLMPLIPIQMNVLMDRKDRETILKQVDNILLGGAAVGKELRSRIEPLVHGNVFETFGMTETLSHIALKRLNGPKAQSSFELLEGVRIRKDERGCLMVQGKVTDTEWVVTKDVVDIMDDKHFVWKGRVDNVINSGGIKIQLEELEATLFPLVRSKGYLGEFMLGGKEDSVLGTRLVLFVEGDKMDDLSLLRFLKQNLPVYHAPKEIIYLEQFPRTPSGKLKRII